MELKFDIAVDDLQVIQDNMDYIHSLFPKFKIISDNFTVQDESLTEYHGGATMFDWKEVVFEINNLNNFWYLAKMVQLLKLEK